jgi:small subunit ribosomal protein S6
LKRYEGMFLFDSGAARDWTTIEQEVHRLCGRINAELLVCVKFDERKLAYEIRRRKRGTYVLTYFEAPENRINDLERDAQLSELILRALVLRADHVPDARINELKAWPAETPLQPQTGDGRRHDEYDRGGRGDWRGSAGGERHEAHGRESAEGTGDSRRRWSGAKAATEPAVPAPKVEPPPA